MICGPFVIHHYSPKNRFRERNEIIIRQTGDPFCDCYGEAEAIYDKVRRLLATVGTWIEHSFDDDITEETVQALYISINKTLAIATKDIEELITIYEVTDRRDVFEIKDVAVQLQEIADEIFKPYIEK